MANIGLTIRTLTIANAGVSALAGSRMYPDALVQNAVLPAIVYQVIDTVATEHLGGIVALATSRIQIDSFATTRAGSVALGEAVRLALQTKHRGDNGGQYIHEISLAAGESYGIDRVSAGSDQRRYIVTTDFLVTYRVATS